MSELGTAAESRMTSEKTLPQKFSYCRSEGCRAIVPWKKEEPPVPPAIWVTLHK